MLSIENVNFIYEKITDCKLITLTSRHIDAGQYAILNNMSLG